jgi:hypothetical protein
MKIGLRRRAFSARSTNPLPRIGSDEAVHETTMSCSCRCSASVRSSIARPLKRRASECPRLERAIRHRQAGGRLRGEMRRAQLDHFARAYEKHVLLVQRREDARRELHRGRRHRHAVRPYLGVGADFLRHGKRALEELVQDRAERPGRLGDAHRFLQLTEDLRLAKHHRVEARRDTERVAHRLLARQRIEVRREIVRAQPVVLGKPGRRALRFARGNVDLGAVAGRQDRRSLAPRPRTSSPSAPSSACVANATRSRISSGAVS